MPEPQPPRAQALTCSGCYTSCSPCRSGRLLLGRRPGAPRRTLAFPPAAAAVPPIRGWPGGPPRVPQEDRRRQYEKEIRPIKLGVTFLFLATAYYCFCKGFFFVVLIYLVLLFCVLSTL